MSVIEFDETRDDGVRVVLAVGDLTGQALGLADETHPLAKALGRKWAAQRVVVDLSEAQYIDSAAIGWLLDAKRETAAAGGRFVLQSPQPRVLQVLQTLQVDRALPIGLSREAAAQLALPQTPQPVAVANDPGAQA
ncbi:MAG: STAS domain-containing protein [Planctomycetota bacterium]